MSRLSCWVRFKTTSSCCHSVTVFMSRDLDLPGLPLIWCEHHGRATYRSHLALSSQRYTLSSFTWISVQDYLLPFGCIRLYLEEWSDLDVSLYWDTDVGRSKRRLCSLCCTCELGCLSLYLRRYLETWLLLFSVIIFLMIWTPWILRLP